MKAIEKIRTKVDWPTTLIPFVIVLALMIVFMLIPEQSKTFVETVRGFLGDTCGLYYALFGVGVLATTLYVAFSKYGKIKLGNLEKPQYSNFKWGTMIFTSTMAADILFYSLCEWALYGAEPHVTEMAGGMAMWAPTFTLFHWGPIAWCFYVILAIAFGFMMHVRKRDRHQAFIRLAVEHDLDICRPTLSITPYDETVIMDITGTPDDILARMKTRGRRDVRKALRESPATYADETAQANASFDEYYDVMLETAERDGFAAAPKADYENTLRILGPEHARVFAGRVDGRVVTWTIATVSGEHAVRYYGASRSDVPNRNFVTNGLIFFEACTFGAEGVKDYDMMGIGSERYPGLNSLNTFKCKFSKDTTHVAPDRDLPVKAAFYASLRVAKRGLDAVRDRRRG